MRTLDMQNENMKSSQREKALSLIDAGITYFHSLKARSLVNSVTDAASVISTSRKSGGRDNSDSLDSAGGRNH